MYIPADPSPAYKPWTWLDVAKHSLNFLGLSWQLFVLVWVTIFEQQRRLFIPFVLLVVGYNSYWIVRFLVQLVYVIVACVVVYAWYNWFFRLAPRSSGRYQALTALRRLVAAQPTTNNSLTFVHSRTPSPERSISPDSRSFREPEETVWWASNNVLRPPPFSQPQAWKEWQKRREKEAVMTGYGEPPGLRIESAKLNQLVEMLINYVVRDFVDSWYRNYVSRELAVSLQIHALLRHITNHLVEDVTKKDFVSFIVNRVLPLFKQHIHECRKAERTLKSIKAYRAVYLDPNMRLEKDDTVESYVARCYRDGYVHDAITEKPVPTLSFELKYLRKLIGVMMKHFCPEREMNSSLVRIFVREVLVSRIVQPSLDYLSDPDYWNQMINRMADFLSAGESNLVNKIQQALEDQQWNGVRYDDGDQGEAGGGDWITADLMESKKIADRFVRYTRQVNNLEESYALHAKVTDDIHEIRSIIGGMAADEYVQGRKVQDFKVHLKRLHTARKRLDARIIDLGGYLEKPTKDSRAMDDLNGPPLRNVLESEDDSLFHVFMAWIRNRDRDRFLLFWIRVNQVLITAAPVIDEKMRTISPTGQDGGDSKSPSPTKTSFQQRGPPRTIRTNSQPGISEITSPISVVDAKTVEREQIEKWRSLADLIIDLHRTFLARGAMYRIDVASPAIGREVDKLITSIDSYVTESNRNVALLDLMGKPFAPNSKDQDFQSFQQDVQLVVRHLMDIQDQVFAVLKSEDYPMFLQSTDYLKYTAQVSPGAQMLSPTKIKTGERIMRAISPIPTDGTGRDEKGTPAVLKGKHSWSGSSPSLLQTATPNLSQRPPLPGDGRLVGNEIEEENQPDSIARTRKNHRRRVSEVRQQLLLRLRIS
ncbi:PXA domain-containing protein [Cladochytrium replicatum]|nr:PXA domain-containing protein [Cladochytrium replicatum]